MEHTGDDEVREGLAEHLVRLWRYGYVLCGRRDFAEDLVQATCVRALEKSHQFMPGTRLDRWLFAILHSIWLNDVRSQGARRTEPLDDQGLQGAHDGVQAAEATVRARQVLRQVEDLPDGQRAAVFLVCVEGFAYREAAEVLKVPIGTIMSRISSARVKLAEMAADPARAASSKADDR